MILNSSGVVLSRRNAGEADRLTTLFTEDMGKIEVRFIGANKSKAKLKALSEPMMWGEYRLHQSPRSEFAKAIGGRDGRAAPPRSVAPGTCGPEATRSPSRR